MRKHIATLVGIEDAHEVRRVPIMNLMDENASIEPERVCRTCVHDHNRSWTLTHEDRMEMLRAGLEPDEVTCAPDVMFASYKLTNNGTVTDLDAYDFDNPVGTEAIVSSCGWSQANKCERCMHFSAHTVQVWREAYEDGPLRPRTMVVGGYCKLGADEPCVPKPMTGRRLDPSCANCKFLYSTHSWHYSEDFNRTVGDIEIDPWVRKQAILASYDRLSIDEARQIGIDYTRFDPRGKETVGLAIFLARMHTHGKLGNDSLTHKRARLVTTRWKTPPEGKTMTGVDSCALVPDEYVVQFDVINPQHFTIAADRTDVHVTVLKNRPGQAMVTFSGEAVLREFKVRWLDRREVTSYEHLTEFKFTTHATPRPDHADRWWASCTDCKKTPGRACYFHAKGIERKYKSSTDLLDYEIDVVDPAASDLDVMRLSPEWQLLYVRDAAGIATNIINPCAKRIDSVLWQLNSRNLHKLAIEASSRGNHSLMKVYWRVAARVPDAPKTARPQWMQPGLGREITELEPMKYYCALNQHFPDVHDMTLGKIYPGRGIDMRLMFGDRFGMERGSVEYSDSWSRKEDEAEWMRAHSAEERISEEIDTTLNYAKLKRAEWVKHNGDLPVPEPLEWHTTRLDLANKPVDDRNFWHDEYDPEHDQENMVEWLDEYNADAQATNRMARYGYSITKGPNEGMYANERDTEVDRQTEFMCITCDARYPVEAIGIYEMTCTRPVGSKDHRGVVKLCSGQLVSRTHIREEESTRAQVKNRAAADMPKRRRTGREGAVLPDSRFFQERNRLARLSCPWWELKGCNDLYPTQMHHLGYDVKAMIEHWQGSVATVSTQANQLGARHDNYAYFAFSSNLETRNYRLWLVGESQFKRGDFYAAMRTVDDIIRNK